MIYYFIVFLALIGCAPSSWEDLRAEGEAETKKLAELLHGIDTKEQLERELGRIKKIYNRFGDLVVAVRKVGTDGAGEPSLASDALFAELARLYEMPGCRALLEEAQKEAIEKIMVE